MKKKKEEKRNNDVRDYIADNFELRVLTKDELKVVNAFDKVITKYNLNSIALLPFAHNKICIFKTTDNSWHVWQIDKGFAYYNLKDFSNVKLALSDAIDRFFLKGANKMHDSLHDQYLVAWTYVCSAFDHALEKEVTTEELSECAAKYDFALPSNEKRFFLD